MHKGSVSLRAGHTHYGTKWRTADNQGNSSHELKLTREQSLARVMSKNQQEDVPEIQAWNVETGQWGGRLGTSLEADTGETIPLTGNQDEAVDEWVARSAHRPFSVKPPGSVLHRIRVALKETNTQYISAHGHVLQDSQSSCAEEVQTIHLRPSSGGSPSRIGSSNLGDMP